MFAIRDDRTTVRMRDFTEAWAKITAESDEDAGASPAFA
jgi:proteasome regulatory subunit